MATNIHPLSIFYERGQIACTVLCSDTGFDCRCALLAEENRRSAKLSLAHWSVEVAILVVFPAVPTNLLINRRTVIFGLVSLPWGAIGYCGWLLGTLLSSRSAVYLYNVQLMYA